MNTAPEVPKKERHSKSVAQEIIEFFSSVRTAVSVLFLIAAASVIGTIIPQGKTLDQLSGMMSPMILKLTAILDLHRLYSSWWYIFLLLILAIQLIACLYVRWPKVVSDWKRDSKKFSFKFDYSVDLPRPEAEEKIKDALKAHMGSSPQKLEIDGEKESLLWIKHRVQEIGFPLAHIAIILIMLGGLIGMVYGFKGRISLLEGKSGNIIRLFPAGQKLELPFEIHLDKFTLKKYDTGAPKEFRSDLRIIENNETLLDSYILVNHPLTHRGISLYQSDYNMRGVDKVTLSLTRENGASKKIEAGPGEPVQLFDTQSKLFLMRLDPGGGPNPAVLEAVVERKGARPTPLRLVENSAEPVEIDDIKIEFLGYKPLYSSGIQVSYDPGTPLVWLGCILLIAGFLLTLFTNHRRVAAHVEELTEGGASILIRGRSKRSRKEFREGIDQAVKDALGLSGT